MWEEYSPSVRLLILRMPGHGFHQLVVLDRHGSTASKDHKKASWKPIRFRGEDLMVVMKAETIRDDSSKRVPSTRLWIIGVGTLVGIPLARAVEADGQIQVVGLFEDLEKVEAELKEKDRNPPDAILVADGAFSEVDLKMIKDHADGVPLIVVANQIMRDCWGDEIPQPVNCALTADTNPQDISAFIRLVRAGYTLVEKRLLNELISQNNTPDEELVDLTELTDTEQSVMACLIDGLSNKEIAKETRGSVGSVKIHIRRILKKLSARNRTTAAVLAVRNGFRDLPKNNNENTAARMTTSSSM